MELFWVCVFVAMGLAASIEVYPFTYLPDPTNDDSENRPKRDLWALLQGVVPSPYIPMPEPKRDPEQGDLPGGDMAVTYNLPLSWSVSAANLWPNGVVPYSIDSYLFTEADLQTIADAIQVVQSTTCLRWIPRTTEDAYARFTRDDGCYSSVGKTDEQPQIISIDYGCEGLGTVLHEMTHCMGFDHEQSRYDRDDFVDIIWKNINTDDHDQFAKLSPRQMHAWTPYDYGSVMHYRDSAFSKDDTSKTINVYKTGAYIGQRQNFSAWDITKLNKMYNCTNYGSNTAIPASYFTTPAKPSPLVVSLPYSCNFEQDECEFEQPYRITDDQLDWARNTGATKADNTGPSKDHTTGSGWYMFIDASVGMPSDTAQLYSLRLQMNSAGFLCIKFYYSLYGSDIGGLTLSVKSVTTGTVQQAWSDTSAKRSGRWYLADVVAPVPAAGLYQLLWTGTIKGALSNMAIDDILISTAGCQGNASALTQLAMGAVSTTMAMKIVTNVQTSTTTTLPTTTTAPPMASSVNQQWSSLPYTCRPGSAADNCLLVTSGSVRVQAVSGSHGELSFAVPGPATAVLVTPQFSAGGLVCLQMFYAVSLSGDSLSLFQKTADGNQKTLIVLSSPSPNWSILQGTLNLNAADQIGFMAVSTSGAGGVYMRRVQLYTAPCQPIPQVAEAASLPWLCDFDDPTNANCGLNQPAGGNANWLYRSGQTMTANTGPNQDHSSGSGHYMYVEASRPAKCQDTAVLRTQFFQTPVVCLRFFANMYGDEMGSLTILAENANGVMIPVYVVSGNKGQNWFENVVTVASPSSTFAIRFQATIGQPGMTECVRSDIAIDDISVVTGACPTGTTAAPVQTRQQVPLPFTCSLQTDFCGSTLQTADPDNYYWHFHDNVDNPTGTGRSAIVHGYSPQLGLNASIVTPWFYTDRPTCIGIQLYVRVSGRAGFQLNVLTDSARQPLVSYVAPDQWRPVGQSVQLTGYFRVEIFATQQDPAVSKVYIWQLGVAYGNGCA